MAVTVSGWKAPVSDAQQAARVDARMNVGAAADAQQKVSKILGGRHTLSQLLVAGGIAAGSTDPVTGGISGGLAGFAVGEFVREGETIAWTLDANRVHLHVHVPVSLTARLGEITGAEVKNGRELVIHLDREHRSGVIASLTPIARPRRSCQCSR